MKIRTVLCADEGTVLTNGTNYGVVIWLAEGVSPNSYHPIPRREYEQIMEQQGLTEC